MTSWLHLTSGSGSVGTAWYSERLQLAAGFDTTFTVQLLEPSAREDRRAPDFGGGVAFVLQSDRRGAFAVGCASGGLGFRADPDVAANCSARYIRTHACIVACLRACVHACMRGSMHACVRAHPPTDDQLLGQGGACSRRGPAAIPGGARSYRDRLCGPSPHVLLPVASAHR